MTGHTSDEVIGGEEGHARGTDAESATEYPQATPASRGVVQDSPGSPGLGMTDDQGGDGNLTDEERPTESDTAGNQV